MLKVLVLLGMVLGCCFTQCRISCAQNITPDQAKLAVKNFEQNPNLDLNNIELSNDSDELNTQFDIYKVWIEGSTSWEVDAVSGEIISASYIDIFVLSDTINQTYSQSQCYDIALNYARQKYANFDNMSFQIQVNEYDADSNNWDFVWYQRINNIPTYNRVYVSVRPDTGQVVSYVGNRVDYTNVPVPAITASHAQNIATSHLELVSNIQTTAQNIYCSRNGTLFWLLNIQGDKTNSQHVESEIYINGTTGDVIQEYTTHLSKAAKTRPAVSKPRKHGNDSPSLTAKQSKGTTINSQTRERFPKKQLLKSIKKTGCYKIATKPCSKKNENKKTNKETVGHMKKK